VLDNSFGVSLSPHYSLPLPSALSQKTITILNRYQNFANTSNIHSMLNMLSNTTLDEALNALNFTSSRSGIAVIENNVEMQVTGNDVGTEISWEPSYGIVGFSSMMVDLTFDKNGNPEGFSDTWSLYTIGGTAVNVSMQEAADLAWRTLMANNITTVNVEGIGNVPIEWSNNAMVLVYYSVRNNFTAYPFYDVVIPSNLPYGSGYCASIGIWADNDQVAFFEPGQGMMLPSPGTGTQVQINSSNSAPLPSQSQLSSPKETL
jgi:hypothetical protein